MKPELLRYSSAPAPGGHIVVTSLSHFPLPLYPADDCGSVLDDNHRERRMDDDVKCSFPQQKKDVRILHLGCGNSEVGVALLKKGYNNIVNLDTSSVLIKKSK